MVQPLDREAISQHILTVMVQDYGISSRSSFTRVIIDVEDNNDHSPVFISDMFDGRVFETAALGTSIVQVLATDKDKGENAEVRYSIIIGSITYQNLIELPDETTSPKVKQN